MEIDNNPEEPDLDSFRIHSRREIGAILQSIMESRQLVQLAVRGGGNAILTSILQVDTDGDTVVVDCGPDEALNRRIVEAGTTKFETMLDGITVRFDVDGIEECLFEERLAFVFPVPTSLIRLQRREYYRIDTPRVNPLQCTIYVPVQEKKVAVILPLENVSGGGVAVIDEKCSLDPTIGNIYEDCRIALPNNTFLIVKLQIRNVREISLHNGKVVRQIGCLFIELPRPMLAAVQRYITALEREHNAKSSRS